MIKRHPCDDLQGPQRPGESYETGKNDAFCRIDMPGLSEPAPATVAAGTAVNGGPQPSASPPSPSGNINLMQAWAKHYDINSSNYYYFNSNTGETSWQPPPGFIETGSVHMNVDAPQVERL